eukprot:455698_1
MFSLCFKRIIESKAVVGRRLLCSQKQTGAGGEKYIENILRQSLDASKVQVEDISGGCGSMYKIAVESPLFRGLSLVKQHKLVKAAISTEIADSMHGLTVSTRPTPE